MTDKERLNELKRLIDRLHYAVEHKLTLCGVDEWCNICEVLGRDVPHGDVPLLDKYIDKYNAARGTDYDWDWMSLAADEPTRTLVEAMRTPDEIKRGLQHCAGDGCEGCSYETDCYGADGTEGFTVLSGNALYYIMQLEAELEVARNQQKMTDDACAYTVSRLKAELIATRVQLAKDGDLCRICKAQRAQDCVGDCIGCDNTACCCKRCIDTDGKEGYEWDGGAAE